MKQFHWTISQTKSGWCLRCTHVVNSSIVTLFRKDFLKFMDAMNAACQLQVHVDNERALPFKQYGKGA